MYITLNKLTEWDACDEGYDKVVERVGKDYDKDKPIFLSTIFEHGDIDDVLWCLEYIDLIPDQRKDLRLLICDFAERVLPIYEKKHPTDSRVKDCIEISRKYAIGQISEEKLNAAGAAAWAAAGAAAWDAAGAAAWAAAGAAAWDAAGAAAWDAAGAAAWDAAGAAAGDAAGAAAWAAAWSAAWAAAGAAERDEQEKLLLVYLLKHEGKGHASTHDGSS